MSLETIFPLQETETLIPETGSLNHAVFLSILLAVLCLPEWFIWCQVTVKKQISIPNNIAWKERVGQTVKIAAPLRQISFSSDLGNDFAMSFSSHKLVILTLWVCLAENGLSLMMPAFLAE